MEGEETIQSNVSLTYNFGDIVFGARDHDNINLRLIQDGPPRGGICESTGARIIDLGGIGKPTREGLKVTFPAGGARDLLRDRGECPGRDGREHLHLESKHGGAENSRSAMRCGGNKRRTMQKAENKKKGIWQDDWPRDRPSAARRRARGILVRWTDPDPAIGAPHLFLAFLRHARLRSALILLCSYSAK